MFRDYITLSANDRLRKIRCWNGADCHAVARDRKTEAETQGHSVIAAALAKGYHHQGRALDAGRGEAQG